MTMMSFGRRLIRLSTRNAWTRLSNDVCDGHDKLGSCSLIYARSNNLLYQRQSELIQFEIRGRMAVERQV